MLRRWDVRVYDVVTLIAILDYVLGLMGLDLRFRRFKRSPRLYIRTLVLKEVCKVSLRYAEALSLKYFGVRVPKSTLHYWEVRHGGIVEEVLKTVFKLLNLIEYDYSVVDSAENIDWLKKLHELFIYVRVRSGGMLFPVHAQLTSSKVEFARGIPEGGGFMLGDEHSTPSQY